MVRHTGGQSLALGLCETDHTAPACRGLHLHLLVTGLDWREGSVMQNDYLRNPHEFDRWLKANAVLGSLLAIGMLAMALAALNPAARPDGAPELASVTSLK